MMTTTMTADRIVDAVCEAILSAQADAFAGITTPGMWVAIRVGTDGKVYETIEVSECYGAAEYFGRVPHTLTVWSFRAQAWNGGDDDCPVDEEGRWYDTPDIDSYVKDDLYKAVEAWIEGGNLVAE